MSFRSDRSLIATTDAESSRSHCICHVYLRPVPEASSAVLDSQGRRLPERTLPWVGKLTFVDLAGSERAFDSKEHDRDQRVETSNINKSLLALKECIRALCSRNAVRIPYRASKLTLVLKDGFNNRNASKLVMIAAVGPTARGADHTINTARYAERVKQSQGRGGGAGSGTAAAGPVGRKSATMAGRPEGSPGRSSRPGTAGLGPGGQRRERRLSQPSHGTTPSPTEPTRRHQPVSAEHSSKRSSEHNRGSSPERQDKYKQRSGRSGSMSHRASRSSFSAGVQSGGTTDTGDKGIRVRQGQTRPRTSESSYGSRIPRPRPSLTRGSRERASEAGDGSPGSTGGRSGEHGGEHGGLTESHGAPQSPSSTGGGRSPAHKMAHHRGIMFNAAPEFSPILDQKRIPSDEQEAPHKSADDSRQVGSRAGMVRSSASTAQDEGESKWADLREFLTALKDNNQDGDGQDSGRAAPEDLREIVHTMADSLLDGVVEPKRSSRRVVGLHGRQSRARSLDGPHAASAGGEGGGGGAKQHFGERGNTAEDAQSIGSSVGSTPSRSHDFGRSEARKKSAAAHQRRRQSLESKGDSQRGEGDGTQGTPYSPSGMADTRADNDSLVTVETTRVAVVVRLRPLNSRERAARSSACLRVTSPTTLAFVRASTPGQQHHELDNDDNLHFTFDAVLSENSTQEDVYACTAKPVLHKFLQGFNGCLFAYGQTSSGKTHTIQGTSSQPGVMPLVCNELFSTLESMDHDYECTTKGEKRDRARPFAACYSASMVTTYINKDVRS